MSVRARHARKLASLLKRDTQVSSVMVRYYRQRPGYAVQWTGGPSATEMQELAAKHAEEIPTLDVTDLAWLRTEPTNPYGRP